jgi:hypothetical protein
VDILKYHWIEENQHTKTGVLEIERLARDLGPEELRRAFDEIHSIGRLVDTTFVGQVEEEIATLQRVTGCEFTKLERAILVKTLHQSMTAIWAEVAFTHPSFKQVALALSKEGAATLGIE